MEEKIKKAEKECMDLLYVISEGSKTDIDAWGGTEVYDFFLGLESRQDAIDRIKADAEIEKLRK